MLTRKERLIIKKVIALIETSDPSNIHNSEYDSYWSCRAIEKFCGKNSTLLKKYTDFYEKKSNNIWSDGTNRMSWYNKEWRLLCLETFLHLNGEIK